MYIQSSWFCVLYSQSAATGENLAPIEHRSSPLAGLNIIEFYHCLDTVLPEDDYSVNFPIWAANLMNEIAGNAIMWINNRDQEHVVDIRFTITPGVVVFVMRHRVEVMLVVVLVLLVLSMMLGLMMLVHIMLLVLMRLRLCRLLTMVEVRTSNMVVV